jgi:tRNA pseudouridine32 synthase/23S rRNA pseudouridine746 synthase
VKQARVIKLSREEVALVRSLLIHEDEHILALNKPAGLSSQGGRGQVNTLDELLQAFVKSSGRRPALVHRLDRDTSGVILTARSQPAASFLGKAVMARRFEKTYLAVVAPRAPDPRDGEIDVPLRREEQGREAYMRVCAPDHPDAETALTRYRTVSEAAGAALVEARPETGRMHQIRVHLAHLGRPIAGDARYGGALMLAGGPVPRLMLHAAALRFPHPGGGWMTLSAPPPSDFTALCERLGLAQARER